jgi:hypothetical protein
MGFERERSPNMEIEFVITPAGITEQPEAIAQALAVIAQAEPTA